MPPLPCYFVFRVLLVTLGFTAALDIGNYHPPTVFSTYRHKPLHHPSAIPLNHRRCSSISLLLSTPETINHQLLSPLISASPSTTHQSPHSAAGAAPAFHGACRHRKLSFSGYFLHILVQAPLPQIGHLIRSPALPPLCFYLISIPVFAEAVGNPPPPSASHLCLYYAR